MARTTVIFGGGSGIGRAAAARLVGAGHKVVIAGRDAARLEAARAELGAFVETMACDAADRAAVDAALGALGAFDHLVVSISGGKGAGAFATLDLADLRAGLEAKLMATLTVVQAAHARLRAGGSITIVTAGSARLAQAGLVGLGAINAALEQAVPKLALELAPIRVNAVSPGVIDTPWWDRVPAERRAAYFAETARRLPVGRVGTADDVARAIELCVENGFVTGVVIDVDGGARLAR